MERLTTSLRSEQIEILTRADVLIAQGRARSFAEQLGFDRRGQWEIAIAVSEAASNILHHAVDGTISLHACDAGAEPRMEFVATDRGGGIEDVDQALVDGVSKARASEPGTASRNGLGCGLGAISRLMDGLTISASPSGGTILRSFKRAPKRAPNQPQMSLQRVS